MEMTPYQRSIEIAVQRLPVDATLDQVVEELRSLGWTETTVFELVGEMAKMAFQLVKEAGDG